MTTRMILTAPSGLPTIRPGDDLAGFILEGSSRAGLRIEEGDIFVVSQKVVSKAEDRFLHLAQITPSPAARKLAREVGKDPRLVEVILKESRCVLRSRPGLIIVEHRLGFVCANAGIDHSNVGGEGEADEWVLLLPEDPDLSAARLRRRIEATSGRRVGVLIIDSHGRAWRLGTVGVAIGVSGVQALLDLRGQPDMFGRRLEVTEVGLADELAAAASVIMGQAGEARPFVQVHGLPYELGEGSLTELLRPPEEDLFR